jgi:hypothetical protein
MSWNSSSVLLKFCAQTFFIVRLLSINPLSAVLTGTRIVIGAEWINPTRRSRRQLSKKQTAFHKSWVPKNSRELLLSEINGTQIAQ